MSLTEVNTPEDSETKTDHEGASRLGVVSALSGIPVQTRELVDNWMLITYDIPATEEGNKARTRFLNAARRMGATSYTESAFYMPWTSEAEVAVVELSEIAKAFVWYSRVKEEDARRLTEVYDRAMAKSLDELDQRLVRITQHLTARDTGLARRMIEKTYEMLDNMEKACQYRGSQALVEHVQQQRQWLGLLEKGLLNVEKSLGRKVKI